jgi:hypothetical protein
MHPAPVEYEPCERASDEKTDALHVKLPVSADANGKVDPERDVVKIRMLTRWGPVGVHRTKVCSHRQIHETDYDEMGVGWDHTDKQYTFCMPQTHTPSANMFARSDLVERMVPLAHRWSYVFFIIAILVAIALPLSAYAPISGCRKWWVEVQDTRVVGQMGPTLVHDRNETIQIIDQIAVKDIQNSALCIIPLDPPKIQTTRQPEWSVGAFVYVAYCLDRGVDQPCTLADRDSMFDWMIFFGLSFPFVCVGMFAACLGLHFWQNAVKSTLKRILADMSRVSSESDDAQNDESAA